MFFSELSGLSGGKAQPADFCTTRGTLAHNRRSIPRVYLALIVDFVCLFACDEACVNLCTWESENQVTHTLGLKLEERRVGRRLSRGVIVLLLLFRNNVPS